MPLIVPTKIISKLTAPDVSYNHDNSMIYGWRTFPKWPVYNFRLAVSMIDSRIEVSYCTRADYASYISPARIVVRVRPSNLNEIQIKSAHIVTQCQSLLREFNSVITNGSGRINAFRWMEDDGYANHEAWLHENQWVIIDERGRGVISRFIDW